MIHSFTSPAGSPQENATPNTSEQLSNLDETMQSFKENIQGFTVTLAELRAVFSAHLFQSMTSYFLWFTLYSWTVTTFFGLFYHSYIPSS